MELIFPAAFAAILYYFRNKGEDFAKSLGKSLLIHQACVLLFANLLSTGNSLNRYTAFAAWFFVIAVVAAIGVKKQGTTFFCIRKEFWQIKHPGKQPCKALTMTERGLLVICIVLSGILLVGALFTVPYNYDSMTYHLARIGHWMDNGSVNYYLTNIDRQLYSPVLSEYNMLFLMLLSGGDRWLNLQQYVSMLITAYYIYKVARMLGTDRTFSIFGVFVFFTMPLTISQSITTQNDLSAAMWYVLFLYYLLWFIQIEGIRFPWKEKELPKDNRKENKKESKKESKKETKKETARELVEKLICIGACVGFAFLMKVSVCASMIFFMPWLLVCCIRRKDRLKDLLSAAGISLGALLVIISETLIRTYISCGSFIADTTSGDIMVATKNVSYIIVNILKNYSLLITQHLWTWINGFIYRIAISVGALLHVEVNNVAIAFHGFDFITYLNTGDDMYSHDRTSSAFAAYFALLAGVLLVIALIRVFVAALKKNVKNRGAQTDKKNDTAGTMKAETDTAKAEEQNRKKPAAPISYGFVISAWLGFGFIMALLRWQPWGSRLMYPALAVTVIAGAHILGAFCSRLQEKKKAMVIIPLATLSFLLCLTPLEYNMKQAKKYLANGCENRTKYYFENNKRYDTYKQLLKQVKNLGAKDIAVVISGDGYDYPLWKMFHDQYPQGKLRHILVDDTNMVLTEAEGEEAPDCILWIERGLLEIGDTLDYKGQTYECVFVADSEKAPDSLLVKKTP